MKHIAYLGLGVMGGGMARTLLKAGYRLTVWDRTAANAKPLTKAGAKTAETPAQCVDGVDTIIYCLSNERAVEDVVFGKNGVLSGVRAGQIVLDASTVHPDTSRREQQAYAKKRVEFLDTPVFGSRNEAASGNLWIMAGGKRNVFEKVRPVLKTIGQTVHYMGGTGSGTSMKLVGNLIVAAQLQALGEAMVLATKAGLAAEDVLGVLKVADFRSPILEGVGGALIRRDFKTNFALKHLLKDANLIAQFARDLKVPLPAAAAIRKTIKAAVNQGWGDENASAMIKELERQAKVVVKR
jgi:3-hydroxyisobutyrate dehydrogenase-like beta-hydroxyacid dehydrogenase